VVSGIDGCSTCGSLKKSFQYSSRLDLTQVTSIDGSNQYTTQYTHDNPSNPWEQVGEVLQKTEALAWPEQRITTTPIPTGLTILSPGSIPDRPESNIPWISAPRLRVCI
jgi:hypothetical protein